jgi:two-component system, OmpR family, response regulator RegX3
VWSGSSLLVEVCMNPDEPAYRILVVDDEPMLLDSLTISLENQGYQVQTAVDGPGALEQAARHRPDLVLLDLMLPGLDGMEVCRELRTRSRVPIIMLTAREDVSDKVQGLELGADDYVTKPFVLRELLARVRAVLRRAHEDDQPLPEPWQLGELEVDETRREVIREGRRVELSPKEFALLRVLARRPGTILSRAQLIDQVWGDEFMGDEKTLDVHIRWLREKIERDPSRPERIVTVRGTGYKFVEEEADAAGDRREAAG